MPCKEHAALRSIVYSGLRRASGSAIKLTSSASKSRSSPPTSAASALSDDPYDGHTLRTIVDVEKVTTSTLRLHDLRVAHGTWLLDQGGPVHTVAKAGPRPSVLLSVYAKRTKKDDEATAGTISRMTAALQIRLGQLGASQRFEGQRPRRQRAIDNRQVRVLARSVPCILFGGGSALRHPVIGAQHLLTSHSWGHRNKPHVANIVEFVGAQS
jgi:hypothetical protein